MYLPFPIHSAFCFMRKAKNPYGGIIRIRSGRSILPLSRILSSSPILHLISEYAACSAATVSLYALFRPLSRAYPKKCDSASFFATGVEKCSMICYNTFDIAATRIKGSNWRASARVFGVNTRLRQSGTKPASD